MKTGVMRNLAAAVRAVVGCGGKKLFLLLALLLPFCSAWAGGNTTTYYARLTVQRAGTGEGKIYAATASTSSPAYQTDAMTVNNNATSKSISFNIYADAPAGTRFTGWTVTGATVANASALATTATISASSTSSSSPTAGTVTANFEEITYSAFSVKFSPPVNGSYTVDGTVVGAEELTTGPFTQVYAPTLAATAASGYVFAGWYVSTDNGATRSLLSQNPNYTPSFEAESMVFAEFTPAVPVTTVADLTTSLANNACTEIPAGTSLTVPSGTTLSVPSGKHLVVSGCLAVEGTLSNAGVIDGPGKIVTIKYVVTQTGASNGQPIVTDCVDASKNKKYYTTTVASASGAVSGTTPSCTVLKGARVVRGGTEVAVGAWPSSATPAVLCCSIDAAQAVNHITGFLETAYNTDVAAGMAIVKGTTNKMLILLASKTLDNSSCSNAGLLAQIGNYQKLQGNFGTMDLAGATLTVSPNYIDTYTHTVLNGGEKVTTLLYSGTITCINCSTVTFSQLKEDYASVINIYDCPISSSKIVSKYNGSNANKNSINFFSSSTQAYKAGDFLSKNDPYHIYGGKWSSKPDDKFIAASLASDYAFYQTEGASTWELQPKANREVVTFGTGEKYETLDEAATALATAFQSADSVTMTMVKNATLAGPITIPQGKTLEVELAGCCITAATGFAINHGTLILGDGRANLSAEGGRIVTTSGTLIANDGTVDVTYGYYTGAVSLTGGTFTTHHGRFTGQFSATDKAYADLRGGYFDTDVSALLADGYFRTGNYVGPFPKPTVTKTWVSSNGGYWKLSMKTLATSDLALYNNASNVKGDYTLANWRRRAEVQSMVQPYLNYSIDFVVGFDRSVAANSVSAVVSKPMNLGTQEIDADVPAGTINRVFSSYFIKEGKSQKRYSLFLSEDGDGMVSSFQETALGVTTSASANYGTTADIRVDLCTGSDTVLTSVHALMSEYVVLGAGQSNKAMIRPATGAPTFYSTLEAAVAAVAEGGTILLCNDVSSTDTVTVSKACTIETNGMDFQGTVVAGNGYELEESATTPNVEQRLGKVHRTFVVTKKTVEIVPPEQGVASDPQGEGANAVIVITPLSGVTTLTITPLEGFAGKYQFPATVTKVTGVELADLQIIRNGHDITGVCALGDEGEITLDPAKATPEIDTTVATPFTVTEEQVQLVVKTIPGLAYALKQAASVEGPYEIVKTLEAGENTRLTFEVVKPAGPAAFYRVEVMK